MNKNFAVQRIAPVILSASILVTVTYPTVKRTTTLINEGVSYAVSIYAGAFNQIYIDPQVEESVGKIVNILKDKYPNVSFNSLNSFFVVEREDNSVLRERTDFSAYTTFFANETFITPDKLDSAEHEALHQMFNHGKYNGFFNIETGDGNAFNEGFMAWLNRNLTNRGLTYKEGLYFYLLKHIISEEELVPMASAGTSTENFKKFWSSISETDIIEMMDKDLDNDLVVESLNEKFMVIIDAFFNYLSMNNFNDELLYTKINQFGNSIEELSLIKIKTDQDQFRSILNSSTIEYFNERVKTLIVTVNNNFQGAYTR